MTRVEDGSNIGLSSRLPGPLRALVNLFSSVWFGITLMVLIFVYCTIASAGLVYPTHPYIFTTQNWEYVLPRFYFDLTEMEAFAWWPFKLLLALFSANLIVVTLRRIPLNAINFGVWMIHTGILILVGGSVYYFSTKVEGDTPVFRRQVEITLPGEAAVARLPALPGNRLSVGRGDSRYDLEVVSTNPSWPLLTDTDAGKTAYAVQVSVTPANGQPFTRQLLAGYPQYTEDIIPGQGRAKKTTGNALVDDKLNLRLAFLPQDSFYVMDSKALYARPVGAPEWQSYALPELPHYQDRIADRDWVWTDTHSPAPPIHPIDRPITPTGPRDPLTGIDARVTGFLRYAPEDTRLVPTPEGFNPVVGFTLRAPGREQDYELEAMNPGRSTAERGSVAFRWANSAEELKVYEEARPSRLRIRVPAAPFERTDAIGDTLNDKPDLEFTPLPGTDYAYRVRSLFNDLPMDSGRFAGRKVSVALVEIRTPQRTFRRWVADPADATRDVSEDNQEIELDPGITMEYEPGDGAIITLVGGPKSVGLHLYVQKAEGQRAHQALSIGQNVELRPELSMVVDYFYPAARRETRPFVVPIHRRDRNAGAGYSCIRLELRKDNWSRALWLPFNSYALPDASYSYRGRIGYDSRQVDLPDGRRVELMFSRERMPLGTQVALDDFQLPTHTGGYTGSAITVRDYVSHVRFNDGDAWSDAAVVKNNNPTEHDGWWYFQATWDPPSGENGGGMNFTGLGVGNRNGVYVQLVGTVIAVIGMIYAFYVKPSIKRRRREAVWASVGRGTGADGNGDDRAHNVVPAVAGIAGRSAPIRSISSPTGAEGEGHR